MQVYKDENEEEVKASTNLWPHALRTAKAGKVTSFTLRQAGDSIQETTGWTDPVDSLSVYAYIAKAQANEAFVEDKRKREDEASETSKRQTRANTRSDGERMQKSTPIPEVQMEDASKDKKQSKVRGPSYKLRSDFELATNLKKVFEERILSSKVEMILGDILGIGKREFHEEIIDIIKRKRHVPVEQETNPTNSQNILHEELEDLEEPRARMENDVVLKAKHAHFHEDEESDEVPRSHFLRSHWARATMETVVKIADFEEPILALVDHGSEINLMSKTLYQKGKWPIDLDHGWRIRAANTQPGFLYGACANVKVTTGDVSDEQNFFVQDHSSYSLKTMMQMCPIGTYRRKCRRETSVAEQAILVEIEDKEEEDEEDNVEDEDDGEENDNDDENKRDGFLGTNPSASDILEVSQAKTLDNTPMFLDIGKIKLMLASKEGVNALAVAASLVEIPPMATNNVASDEPTNSMEEVGQTKEQPEVEIPPMAIDNVASDELANSMEEVGEIKEQLEWRYRPWPQTMCL
ncbi:hypothetical protein L7F22_037122 [Adiantum nelumboides]|nr:hypothetical protein [Adiantum nelumboides]